MIGKKIKKPNYFTPQEIDWCQQNNAHVEEVDGFYVILQNAPAPEPTTAERVYALENAYLLPRPVRELVTAAQQAGQPLDAELLARVAEIEMLAGPLRSAFGADGL